jgi:hypothetical protein
MLVQHGSGKSGVAFEIVLEKPEADFVLVARDGMGESPVAKAPRRLSSPTRVQQSIDDVIRKVQDADARRQFEMNRVRGAARRHNAKVSSILRQVNSAQANKYWQLDSKLKAADRRREEIVSQIRSRAHEHSERVQSVHRAAEDHRKSLDLAISECLFRAAENRMRRLGQVQARIAAANSRKEMARKAHEKKDSRMCMDAFWCIDRKQQQANRRRRAQMDEIRERAASPSDKVIQIRRAQNKQAELKAERLASKIATASARKDVQVNTIRMKAGIRSQHVQSVHLEQERKVSDLDAHTHLRLLKAEANRVQQLENIRRHQKLREIKAEKVRFQKKVLSAGQ